MKVIVTAVGLLAVLGPGRSWAGGPAQVALPAGPTVADVEFDRHVASLLGRLGCNTRACHGSFQGRGGLSLSLFGHDREGRCLEALSG